ncbi:MAG: hypothetical protein ACTHJL_13135, partial [Amnibacterium sp.]
SWPRTTAPAPTARCFVADATPAALVTARPAARCAQLLEAGIAAAPPDGGGDVLVGSPDQWQAQWARFGRLAADGLVLVDGVPAGALRSLTGTALVVPPVGGPDDVLAIRAGEAPARMRLPRRPA